MLSEKATTIEDYISHYPASTQKLLNQMRNCIAKAAPKAEEAISYGMPTFKLNGNLVHFAANKAHIGFYPAPSGIIAFEKELKEYVTSKGAIQFPFEKKLPLTLISKIVKFRAQENLSKPVKKK
jgi:uncharacterized protein YdhG (YjbR/CyaY superfamily)